MFNNITLARIEAEFPAFARDLADHQVREGMTEGELLAALDRCIAAVMAEKIAIIVIA